jgi:hypothetical protein
MTRFGSRFGFRILVFAMMPIEKIMRRTIVWTIMLSVPLCGGCATVMRGSHQVMSFQTLPPGATVYIDGHPYTTPVNVSLQRKVKHQVVVELWKYRTEIFSIDPQWDGISLIGAIIIPGGSLGLVADRVSGADMMFFKMTDILLVPTTQPSAPPIVLNDFRGHLLTDTEVALAVEADRNDRSQFFRGQP